MFLILINLLIKIGVTGCCFFFKLNAQKRILKSDIVNDYDNGTS